jgi:Transposase DDE domain group 1
MTDDSLLPFCFPAIGRKKVTAAFDGGRLSSDGGVMLLAQAERRLGLAERLAAVIPDGRDQSRVTHLLPDILRARIFAIACGYEDADDLDRLRLDPAFKLACGRLPDSGVDLCSQPTVSRWENAPTLRDLVRLMGVMVDLYCASYSAPPVAVTFDPRLRRGRLSTTLSMSSTATSSFRSSMRITMSAAFCRSTSTTPPPAGRSRSSCALARRPPARRCAAISAASSAASANTGQTPT